MNAPDRAWQPFMLTRIAEAYTGRSRWVLARAVRDGALQSVGRNGRSMVFRREDLDAWLVGNSNAPVRSAQPRAVRNVPRAANSNSALERLALIRKGARR